MKSHYISKSGPITVGKLKAELKNVPDEFRLTPHEWGWLSEEPPIEPDRMSMRTTTLEVPAGTRMWLEDNIWEFDEKTTITIESPLIEPSKAVPTVAEYEEMQNADQA